MADGLQMVMAHQNKKNYELQENNEILPLTTQSA
jgi:hypothetical protein